MEGWRVIKEIYRRGELYHGDAVDKAPDLVLVPGEGFNLRAGLFREEIFEREEGLSGKHTEYDALLYVRGVEGDALPESPSIEDVLPIFQRLMEGEPS